MATSRLNRVRRTTNAGLAAAFVLPILATGAIAATAPSEPETGTQTPTAPPAPEPITPPADSVFEGTAGGELLGTVGGHPVVSSDAPELPDVDAPCWLLADADTGHVLAARNAHEPRPPASTIKLLSAVSALPEIGPDITYTATSDAANIEGSKVGLVPDQEYTLDNILHGMFLASGNDTAYALGELVGGQERMLDLMNSTADELGAFDTEAKTPHGLDTEGQLSSAYDLALIGREALHNDQILELAGTPTYDFPGLDDETYQIQNTNRLLGSYEGVIGLKNGFTTEARHTLVAAAQRGGTTLLAVVMGTDDRAEASVADLLDWGFSAVEVDPVGELVTREDVIAAAESRDADATEEAEPTSAAPRDGGEGSAVARELSEPILSARVAMLGGAVAVVSILGIAIKRRPRPGGRYSSGRR